MGDLPLQRPSLIVLLLLRDPLGRDQVFPAGKTAEDDLSDHGSEFDRLPQTLTAELAEAEVDPSELFEALVATAGVRKSWGTTGGLADGYG